MLDRLEEQPPQDLTQSLDVSGEFIVINNDADGDHGHAEPLKPPLSESFVDLSASEVKEVKKEPATDPQTPEAQYARDVDMIRAAIEKPGEDRFSGEILAKIYTLLHHAGLRHYKDGSYQPWNLPLASSLAHGARVTLQVPKEIEEDFFAWLFEGAEKDYSRLAATHGIEKNVPEQDRAASEEVNKKIREIKVPLGWAAWQVCRLFAADAVSYLAGEGLAKYIRPSDFHYGINLALGGYGNTQLISGKTVRNDGQNGHLYILYSPADGDAPGGLLIGIEQSAPGEHDQYGGTHSALGSHHPFTATYGGDFAKENELKGQGPDRYYDSIFAELTGHCFEQIKRKKFDPSILASRSCSESKRAPVVSRKKKEKPQPQRLGPNEIFDFSFTKLLKAEPEHKEPGYKKVVTLIPPQPDEKSGEAGTVYGARFTVQGASVTLLSPACDHSKRTSQNRGATLLPATLDHVLKLQKEHPENTYLIPIMECHGIFEGWINRQHATMLMIKGKTCYFFDPCANGWFSLSASTLYSLVPLKEILSNKGFQLADKDIHYLGWQQDNFNCGRFTAEIASRAAEFVFDQQALENVGEVLKQKERFPKAKNLEKESACCMTDKAISGNQAICVARGQGFFENEVKLDAALFAQSGSGHLRERAAAGFFEKGEGGLKQLRFDLERRELCFNGQAVEKEAAKMFTVEEIANRLSCSLEEAGHLVAAHSQGPLAFLPFLLDAGIEPEEEEPQVRVMQPEDKDLQMNIKKENGQIKLILTYRQFRIRHLTTSAVGTIEGPVTVSYQLKQQNEKWGWALEKVNTDHPDVLKTLNGRFLPEQHLIDHYCHLPEAPSQPREPLTDLVKSVYFGVEEEKKEDREKNTLRARVEELEHENERLKKEREEVTRRSEEQCLKLAEELRRIGDAVIDSWERDEPKADNIAKAVIDTAQRYRSVIEQDEMNARRDQETIQSLKNQNTALCEEIQELKAQNATLDNRITNTRAAFVHQASGWQVALAGFVIALGIAAFLTGVGALGGVILLASLATWATVTLTAGGALAATLGGTYVYSVSCRNQNIRQAFDSVGENVGSRGRDYDSEDSSPRPIRTRYPDPSQGRASSRGMFSGKNEGEADAQSKQNDRPSRSCWRPC